MVINVNGRNALASIDRFYRIGRNANDHIVTLCPVVAIHSSVDKSIHGDIHGPQLSSKKMSSAKKKTVYKLHNSN